MTNKNREYWVLFGSAAGTAILLALQHYLGIAASYSQDMYVATVGSIAGGLVTLIFTSGK